MAATAPKETIDFPSILFKIQDRIFCANSRYISSILELPEHQPLPDTPPYITGIFSHRGGSVTMFDLRSALNLPTLAGEFETFSNMLDQRKQDHLNWVNTLEQCVRDGTPFPLATDAHKCALGQWYDGFHTDSQVLSHHLSKMEEPHHRLHHAAHQVIECTQLHDQCQRGVCLKKILTEVNEECVPRILSILDDAKDIFRTRTFHEMVLLLSGERSLGVVVDEVLAVEYLSEERTDIGFKEWCFSPYLSRIMHSANYDELIMEVNVPEILRSGDEARRA